MSKERNLTGYILLMVLLILLGLPARVFQEHLPYWYTQYFGDFLWAMLIYFLYAVIFRLNVRQAFFITILTTYLIEVSQLFHPVWLERLRSCKICALVLGYGFLWSDLVAYTLGISLGAVVDGLLWKKRMGNESAKAREAKNEAG